MFARVTTYELPEGKASESVRAFEPAIERIRALEGLVEAYFLVQCDGAQGMTMTLWTSRDAMERSRVAASTARTEAAKNLDAEVSATYEFEVGVHRTAFDVEQTAVAEPTHA